MKDMMKRVMSMNDTRLMCRTLGQIAASNFLLNFHQTFGLHPLRVLLQVVARMDFQFQHFKFLSDFHSESMHFVRPCNNKSLTSAPYFLT